MSEDKDPIVGHKTYRDGHSFRHEPLRQSEADEIMKRVEEATAKRIELMPTERDAIRLLTDAFHRLEELGWRRTCYGPTNVEVQLIEVGSSGIHIGSRWEPWPETTWWLGPDGAPSCSSQSTLAASLIAAHEVR